MLSWPGSISCSPGICTRVPAHIVRAYSIGSLARRWSSSAPPDCYEASSQALDLRRVDESGEDLEASFRVRFASFDQLDQAKRALREHDPSIHLSFVDSDHIL